MDSFIYVHSKTDKSYRVTDWRSMCVGLKALSLYCHTVLHTALLIYYTSITVLVQAGIFTWSRLGVEPATFIEYMCSAKFSKYRDFDALLLKILYWRFRYLQSLQSCTGRIQNLRNRCKSNTVLRKTDELKVQGRGQIVDI